MALLEVRKLSKLFGGLVAVNDLDLDIDDGEIFGLIGPNGAGKTTFFNLVSGVLPATSGEIIFNGNTINGLKAHKIAKMGLVRTFQATILLGNMTTLENVLFSEHLKTKPSLVNALLNPRPYMEKEKNALKDAMEILEFMDLVEHKDELASNLPHGYQRSLGVAMALATNPKLLLLDEPVTGMNTQETRGLMDKVREIKATHKGVKSILLIEHDMNAIMGNCDRIAVLNFGLKIAEGPPEEIRHNKEVVEAYLGKE